MTTAELFDLDGKRQMLVDVIFVQCEIGTVNIQYVSPVIEIVSRLLPAPCDPL